MKKGFTFIEILVVTTIIILLAGVGAVSYTALNKSSRDAKRKADLENVKAALEMYRSNNSYYPTTANFPTALTGTTKYIQSIPIDPKDSAGYDYEYQALPNGCNNTTTICSDYVYGALLEGNSSCTTPPSTVCKTGLVCNYCVGPYGNK